MAALCLSSYISLASNNVVQTPEVMHGGPKRRLQMAAHRARGKRVITSVNSVITTDYNQSDSVVEIILHPDGIGIVEFLRGKSLLITGCTGFLGKVLLEKILRTAADVDKIFALIKAKNKEAAMERLKNEIIRAELFDRLKEIHGKSYEAFMLSKLDPVVGTLSESNLGLDEDTTALVAGEVDIIVNVAANTTFDERYDKAIEINTSGPTRLMGFAKLCQNLKVFIQVSSAYVNGKREGRIMEKHFSMDESILLNGKQPRLRVEDEILLILESKQAMVHQDSLFLKKMKELGKERANTFGWQDVYTFTKAMGEMVLESSRGDTPLVIMRPSIIESTYREPIPGWIQGNRMLDPLIQHYGNGNLPGFLADPNVAVDIIPADMVVNAILAAMAKHGKAAGKSESNVYQVASSSVNPFLIAQLIKSSYEHFDSSPLMGAAGSPIRPGPFAFFSSMEDLSSYLGRLEIRSKMLVEQVKRVAKMYEHYTFYHGRFDISNTKTLMGTMSEEEREIFAFDIESLDWEDYIKNVHIPGLRKYVIKEK